MVAKGPLPAGEHQQQQQQQGSRKRRSKQPLDEAVRAWLVGMSLADCCDAFAQVLRALFSPHEPPHRQYHHWLKVDSGHCLQ